MPYFGHKVVPHAQLRGNELFPVCGSLCGHRRRGSWRLLHRAPRNQHPHVEPTSVSIYILRWGLRGSHWGKEKSEQRCFLSKTMNYDKVSLQQTSVCCSSEQMTRMS